LVLLKNALTGLAWFGLVAWWLGGLVAWWLGLQNKTIKHYSYCYVCEATSKAKNLKQR
jgi:hypothetical protein